MRSQLGEAHGTSGRAKRKLLRPIRGPAALPVVISPALTEGTNDNGVSPCNPMNKARDRHGQNAGSGF